MMNVGQSMEQARDESALVKVPTNTDIRRCCTLPRIENLGKRHIADGTLTPANAGQHATFTVNLCGHLKRGSDG